MNTAAFAKKIFGSSNIKGIEAINKSYSRKYKIIVFVPQESVDELTFTMAFAGAGVIGNYTVCSFRTRGAGTFIGGKSTNPFTGTKGKFVIAEEIKLEMTCDEEALDAAIDAMYMVHPYEEPAYEIYPLMVRAKKANNDIIAVSFKKHLELKTVLSKINKSLDIANLKDVPKSAKIRSAIIDFSGGGNIDMQINSKKRVLYLTKNSNSAYNIRLV
jgi:hypothetical protein